MSIPYPAGQPILPLQGWKVFVSYRNPDLADVSRLAHLLEINGAQVRYWDRDKLPGLNDWEVIKGWVQWANCVIVLVTQNTLQDSLPVGNEVGLAIQQKKLVIPLVEVGVDPNRLGLLQGLVYVKLDREAPLRCIQEIAQALLRHTTIQQQQLMKGVGILAGILGFLWLFGGENK